MFYTRFKAELCEIILAGDENGLKHLHLNTGEGKRRFEISPEWKRNNSFFEDSIEQINEYLNGNRKTFNIRTAPEGTDFQKRVWKQLERIPYGETRSYGDIASEIGNGKAARAAGMANSKNPIPVIIPCHRVIGKNGNLTGFAHGLKIKEELLKIEQRTR